MSEIVIMMAMPGGTELVLVLAVCVLLFGASEIPWLARATGESIGEFKKGREATESELAEMDGEEA